MRRGDHDDVADPQHTILSAEDIYIRRSPKYHDCRHGGSYYRQCHRQHAHVTVGHEQLHRRVLFASRAAVVQSNAGQDDQHENEDGLVPSCEHRGSMVKD